MIRGRAWKVHSMFLAVLLLCTMAWSFDHESKGLSPAFASSASSKILSTRNAQDPFVDGDAGIQEGLCHLPAGVPAGRLRVWKPRIPIPGRALVRVLTQHRGNLPSRRMIRLSLIEIIINLWGPCRLRWRACSAQHTFGKRLQCLMCHTTSKYM